MDPDKDCRKDPDNRDIAVGGMDPGKDRRMDPCRKDPVIVDIEGLADNRIDGNAGPARRDSVVGNADLADNPGYVAHIVRYGHVHKDRVVDPSRYNFVPW